MQVNDVTQVDTGGFQREVRQHCSRIASQRPHMPCTPATTRRTQSGTEEIQERSQARGIERGRSRAETHRPLCQPQRPSRRRRQYHQTRPPAHERHRVSNRSRTTAQRKSRNAPERRSRILTAPRSAKHPTAINRRGKLSRQSPSARNRATAKARFRQEGEPRFRCGRSRARCRACRWPPAPACRHRSRPPLPLAPEGRETHRISVHYRGGCWQPFQHATRFRT